MTRSCPDRSKQETRLKHPQPESMRKLPQIRLASGHLNRVSQRCAWLSLGSLQKTCIDFYVMCMSISSVFM